VPEQAGHLAALVVADLGIVEDEHVEVFEDPAGVVGRVVVGDDDLLDTPGAEVRDRRGDDVVLVLDHRHREHAGQRNGGDAARLHAFEDATDGQRRCVFAFGHVAKCEIRSPSPGAT
jgi:hypothetical protein